MMDFWIIPALLSQFMFSFSSLIDKFLLSRKRIGDPYVYLAFAGIANILFLFILPFAGISKVSLYAFSMAFVSSTAAYAGFLFFYKAVKQEEISRITIFIQITPIIVLVLSYLFLKEVMG